MGVVKKGAKVRRRKKHLVECFVILDKPIDLPGVLWVGEKGFELQLMDFLSKHFGAFLM